MKYLTICLSIILFTGCSSIKWVTVKNGQIINDNQRPTNILGNPQMTCYNDKNQLVAKGYFVRQTDIGDFIIDEYGTQYVIVEHPNCLLGRNEKK